MSLSLALERGLGEAPADVVALPFVFFELPFSFTVDFFGWEGGAGNVEDVFAGLGVLDWGGYEGRGAGPFGLDSMKTGGASLLMVGDGGT
jgi:hypothetical protein